MSDLIDKQVVLGTIHRFFTEEVDKIPTKKTEDGEVYVIHKCQPLFEMNKAICKRIKALPSVSPTQNCVGNALDMRCDDAISRQAVLDVINLNWEYRRNCIRAIEKLPSVKQEPRWIPVSEMLPDNTDPVNITWVNHDPESYYADIKDKPFTATGHYCNGRWWWYSVTCQDYLDEYGRCDVDAMDDAIEVIAWMPLPEPYKAESEG